MNTSKIFHFVAQQLSKADYKEFKADINSSLEQYVGRTLNPSNLNEFTSSVIGAENSNVVASCMKASSVDDIVSIYLTSVHYHIDNKSEWMRSRSLFPLAEFYVKGVRLELSIEVYHDQNNENISVEAYINAPDLEDEDDEKDSTGFVGLAQNGGDMLSSMARTVYMSEDDSITGNIVNSYVNVDSPKKVSLSPPLMSMYGLKKSTFNNVKNFHDLDNLINTSMTMISGDLNMRLGLKGRAKVINSYSESVFCLTLA